MPGSTAHCTTFKGPGEKKKEKGKGDAKKNQGLLIFFSSLWVNFQHVVAVVYSFFSSFFFLRACVCAEKRCGCAELAILGSSSSVIVTEFNT